MLKRFRVPGRLALKLKELGVPWQTQVRLLFLTEIALWKYRVQLPGFEMPKALILQQRHFDDRFASTLGGMADRLEGRSPPLPTFGNSVPERQVRNRIQTLTSSLAEEI